MTCFTKKHLNSIPLQNDADSVICIHHQISPNVLYLDDCCLDWLEPEMPYIEAQPLCRWKCVQLMACIEALWYEKLVTTPVLGIETSNS